MKRALLAACLVWALTAGVRAQLAQDGRTGDLMVTVVDQTGQPLSTAEVMAVPGTAEPISGEPTTTPGEFRFAELPQGKYTLTVKAEGFAPVVRTANAPAGRVTKLRVTLTVHLTERVEVKSSNGQSGNSARNLSAVTLTGDDLKMLPNQPAELLIRLREIAGTRGLPGDVALYIDGFRVDGVRALQRMPPRDAIEVIRINANAFSAEFAESGSRRIEIITKPGSDGFYGQATMDYNNSRFNARNAFAPSRVPVQARSSNGYVSVPIVPGRVGLLIYAGRWEQNDTAVINAAVVDSNLRVLQLSESLVAPSWLSTVTAKTGYSLKGTNFSLEYGRDEQYGKNQGLTKGFDLPERAVRHSGRNDAVRFGATTSLGGGVLHEFRLEAERRQEDDRAVTQTPAILVLNSFNAGGNQDSLSVDKSVRHTQILDSLTFATRTQNLKIGASADGNSIADTDRSNFGGTFVFGAALLRGADGIPVLDANGSPEIVSPLDNYRLTLLGAKGYGPTEFWIATGNPTTTLSQWEYASFVQEDWFPTAGFSLSLGLRHEFQTNLGDHRNFGPRLGLAWSLDQNGKNTIRVGAGLFFTRVEPAITLDTIRLDANHERFIVVQQPGFAPATADSPARLISGVLLPQTTRTKAPDMRAPELSVGTIGFERVLPWKMFASLNYTFQRGQHLLRTRDVNAPLPGAPDVRPMPDLGPVLQFESSGRSLRHEMLASFRVDLGPNFRLFSNYTLASTRNDTDGPGTTPANSYDLGGEYSRAATDYRHQAFIGGQFGLPWGWMLAPAITWKSGGTFNITTGRDNNGDTLLTDRPGFAQPGDPNGIVTPWATLTSTPVPNDPIIPRNFGRQPGQSNVSLSIDKIITIGSPQTSKRYLMLGINGENIFNRVNFGEFNGVITSPNFGKANIALASRKVSLSASVGW